MPRRFEVITSSVQTLPVFGATLNGVITDIPIGRGPGCKHPGLSGVLTASDIA